MKKDGPKIVAIILVVTLAGIVSFFGFKPHPNETLTKPAFADTIAPRTPIATFTADPTKMQETPNNGEILGGGEIITPSSHGSTNPKRLVTLPILMYHHVGPVPADADGVTTGLTVSTEDFEAEVAWISSQGYHSISLANFYASTQGKFNLPSKPIIFTFDDGYLDAFENAIPILIKYNYTGSFGIITGWTGAINGNNVYATWDQISKARSQGMEIVSHTQNHFDGTDSKFDANYIFNNLVNSITDIHKNLGFTTNILIYPYGHSTPTYKEEAKKAGFVMGITTIGGAQINLDDLMMIPRIRVNHLESLDKFKKNLREETSR